MVRSGWASGSAPPTLFALRTRCGRPSGNVDPPTARHYGFQMLETLHRKFPAADPAQLALLADVWSVEASKIIDRMLRITAARGVESIPPQARPEAIFELAKLTAWLEGQIIEAKTAQVPIQEIDPAAERDALKSQLIRDRIENTASILAEHMWRRLCERWWERFPAIPQESAKSVKRLGRHPQLGGTRRMHYSPAFSNKHWASAGKLCVYTLGVDGTVRSNDVPARSWGRESFLYSQELEYWFSLVEGDAGEPYKKLLDMVPLNEDETKRWVAYLAVQWMRTPAFILRLLRSVSRFVTDQSLDFPTDTGSLRRAYETLFSNDRMYAEMYQRLVGRRWEMWRTAPDPGFIRPDEVTLVTSGGGKSWRLVYPMTPTHCFVAGPAAAEEPRHVVPHVRTLDNPRLAQLNLQLAASSRRAVIARPQTDDAELRDLLASGMRRRSLEPKGAFSREFWGPISR